MEPAGTGPLPAGGLFCRETGVGAPGLNKHHSGQLQRKRQEGRRPGSWRRRKGPAATDPFCFSSLLGLSMEQEGRIHFATPTVTRFALGQGSQAPGRIGVPGTSPCAPAFLPLCGFQPSPEPAFLMLLPNTRPLIGLFQRSDVPKQSSRPELGLFGGKLIVVRIKQEGKIIFPVRRYSLAGSRSGPWGFLPRPAWPPAVSPPLRPSAELGPQLSSPQRLFSLRNENEKPCRSVCCPWSTWSGQ